MGTQQDIQHVLRSETENAPGAIVNSFEQRILSEMGFVRGWSCVGQVYPRSHDYGVLHDLIQLASAPTSFATTVRLMAGDGLLHEGFGKDQKGSSAMPHKMNSRTCERICGLMAVLKGYSSMIENLVGDQWFEGDVSCSVVRRVAIQGSFFALDSIYESVLTVLDEMEVFPDMVQRELSGYLPFLSTTRVLMESVKRGAGRENAHTAIRDHSLAALRTLRSGGKNDLAKLLGDDPAIPLTYEEVQALLEVPDVGRVEKQLETFSRTLTDLLRQYPDACAYTPQAIL